MNAWTIVTLAVLAMVVVGDQLLRRYVSNRIQQLYVAGEADMLLDYTKSLPVTSFYPAFNCMYMRLNAYVLKDDVDNAKKILSELLAEKRLDAKQRLAVVTKAFEYYMEHDDYQNAGLLLPELESSGNEPLFAGCRRFYEILANGSTAYVDEMESELKKSKGIRRGQLLYLLARQYENKGDAVIASDYERRSVELLGGLASDGNQT